MYSYVIFLYKFFSMLFLSSQRLFVTQTKRKHTIWSIRFRVIICASESRLVNSKRIWLYISLETKQLFSPWVVILIHSWVFFGSFLSRTRTYHTKPSIVYIISLLFFHSLGSPSIAIAASQLLHTFPQHKSIKIRSILALLFELFFGGGSSIGTSNDGWIGGGCGQAKGRSNPRVLLTLASSQKNWRWGVPNEEGLKGGVMANCKPYKP